MSCTSEVSERRWFRPRKRRRMSKLSDFDSPDVASGPSKSDRNLISRRARRARHFAQPYSRPICWPKTSFFQEKTRFSGGGTPIGALQHVHQGSAAATLRARGLAKTVRRTVPYGFSCSSCAHMGRLAPRFSHVPSPQQPRSRPCLLENTTLAIPGKGMQHMSFFRILAHCWVRTLAPRTRATHGLLLDKKYFLLKRQCLREVRAQM